MASVKEHARHRVVGGILIRAGRALLCRRRSDLDWHPDVWDVAGGHVEADESGKEAIVRECWEELGIHASRIVHIATERTSDADIEIFEVTSWVGEPFNHAAHEHAAIGWFSIEELSRLPVPDTRLIPYIADLIRRHATQARD